ncbi:ABC transporter permease [Bacteroidota bacterium]
MIWSIAWKNVWRNKIRSLVVIIAFTLGIFGGLFTVAIMVGMIDKRVDLAISNEVGHVQIHHNKFKENFELKYTIPDYKELEGSIQKIPEVTGVSSRLKIFAMASTAGSANGVMVNGVDVENEKKVSKIDEFIVEEGGSFFDTDSRNPIVIGKELAEHLKLTYYKIDVDNFKKLEDTNLPDDILLNLDTLVGMNFRTENDFEMALQKQLGEKDAGRYMYKIKEEAVKYKLRRKIVLQFQDANGNLAYGAFKVIGVYKSSNNMFDELNVFVHRDDLLKITGIPEKEVHEIAVLIDKTKESNEIASKIKSFTNNQLTVETWEEVIPEISMMNEMMDFYLLIFMIIILLALGFGIVNTMLMAVLERIKELGMLMAIGMNKKRVFRMIMLESIFLSLVGTVFGMLISYLIIDWTGRTGIDLSRFYGEGFEAMGLSAVLYPSIDLFDFMQVTILVIITGILASVMPARKALKLNPVEALRTE